MRAKRYKPLDPEPPLEAAQEEAQSEPKYPRSWIKGQLLNVRNTGATYDVTLLGEEYDYRTRNGIQFTNPAECQAFISAWYMPESASPLAR